MSGCPTDDRDRAFTGSIRHVSIALCGSCFLAWVTRREFGFVRSWLSQKLVPSAEGGSPPLRGSFSSGRTSQDEGDNRV